MREMLNLAEIDSPLPIITRMVFQNLFAEELPVDMRIDFGGSNFLMSQHLLDGAQVGSAFQQVCGKGMAEGVRTDFLMDARQFGLLLEGFEHFWSDLFEAERETFKQDYAEWYRICTSLKEDDNPVLMRIKVKSFERKDQME